jgi:hypothetical protein
LRKRIKDTGKNPSSPWWLFAGKQLYYRWQERELADLVSKDSKIIRKIEEKVIELLELF